MLISDPPELKHAPVYRYNRWIRPMFQKVLNTEMEVLAVMREPIDWLGSWYRFRQRPFMQDKVNSTIGISFDEFVEGYCKGQRPAYSEVGSQAKFLEAQPNGCKVTHLFRYEDQAGLKAFLEDRLDFRLELGRENVSPTGNLDLSPRTKEKLLRKHAEEFELYHSIT